MMQVDDRYEGPLTPEKVDRILEGLALMAERSSSSRNFDVRDAHTLARLPRDAAATRRWDKALRDGARRHHRRGEEVQPPRAGRRGLPDRGRSGRFIPKGSTGAEVPRGERRRGRAGHVQGPLPARARPARPHRGHAHRRARHRLARWASSTSAASTCSRGGVFSARGERSLRRGSARARACSGRGSTSTSWSTAAPAPTSAARRPASSRPSRARRAGPRSSRRSRRSRAPSGSRPSSTTWRRSPAVPHIVTRGAEWFAGLGTKTQGGTRLYSVSGHVVKPGRGARRRSSVTLRSLIYDHCGGIRERPRAQGGGAGRLVRGHPHRRRDRRHHGRGRAQEQPAR